MPTAPLNDPLAILADRFRAAIRAAFPSVEGEIDPLITVAKQPEFGDFQSNVAMSLSKRVGQNPRQAAAAIVAHAKIDDIAEPLSEKSIAGPGFINIRLRSDALAGLLTSLDTPSLGLEPVAAPQTIVVDLMGVNLAKQMHVGHLRSPIIGDAVARMFERLGHRVIRQNHVGDWGLPIAMVTARLMRLAAAGKIDLDRITLTDLDVAYKAAQAECQRDMAGLEAARKYGLGPKAIAELEEQVGGATEAFLAARQTLINLQAKEPATYAVWRKIYEVTMQVCLAVCKTLLVNVTEEHNAGESSYADELGPMIEDLTARGVAEVDQGALIIRLDAPPYPVDGGKTASFDAIKEPCLVRKTDGGFLYATTDICAIRRRVRVLGAERAVYCIDARQALHMKQVFAGSLRAGYAFHPETGAPARLEHAAFGAVLGEDGRPFKTRSGENVALADLIGETFRRATDAVKANSPELSADEASKVAEAVGIAALKYADLSNDRARDYVFSFDRLLAFEGNTGPYLLYAVARCNSIMRRGRDEGAGGFERAPFLLSESAEKSLALALLRYPAAVQGASESVEPHRICQYLYELAGTYSVFFDRCPVLKAASPELRASRLRLCGLVARVLSDGLKTIGVPTVERM
ncbi:MAG: arginine--tRNA ligase [Phycisphaerales bacterium]